MKTAAKVISIIGIVGVIFGIFVFILLGQSFYNGDIFKTFGTVTVNGEVVTEADLNRPEIVEALHVAGIMFFVSGIIFVPMIVLEGITIWRLFVPTSRKTIITLGILNIIFGNQISGILMLLLKKEDTEIAK